MYVATRLTPTGLYQADGPKVPHPDEKEYVITETGQHGDTWTHHLVHGKPSPELDDAWYDLLKRMYLKSILEEWAMIAINPCHIAFNTRVPAERYEAAMNNRPSVRVADGSDNPDYYVTLTVYHELHCLVCSSTPVAPFFKQLH